MKFAKELERDAVPEWRIKYLNYKAGKKYVKAVARAVNRANGTTPKLRGSRGASLFGQPPNSNTQPTLRTTFNDREYRDSLLSGPTSSCRPPAYTSGTPYEVRPSPARAVPVRSGKGGEDDALNRGPDTTLQYGSFVPTPPNPSPLAQRSHSDEFELPAPAMRPAPDASSPDATVRTRDWAHNPKTPSSAERRNASTILPVSQSNGSLSSSWNKQKRRGSTADQHQPSPLRRIFSYSPTLTRNASATTLGMEPFDLVREREHDFYEFMDSELDKVESFYKLKEEQAGKRLELLREQLHEMRNRRLQEIVPAPTNAPTHEHLALYGNDSDSGTDRSGHHWMPSIKTKLFPPGPNSNALRTMPNTPYMSGRVRPPAGPGEGQRDYIRRPDEHDVSYRTAKRKLKLALQEFYRGLELLKSYALLNRTAFRKINKKFDKAVHARPPLRYVNEKVNKAWFVNSDLLEGHIKAVEDLYARYFERGNHKLAAGKLRSLAHKTSDESGSSFLNGFLIGTGIVFSVQGLVYGVQLLYDDDPRRRLHTSYLLQIYAGYFLMLLLFAFFCLNCYVWTRCKVNYPFIFELDPRSRIDWRRMAEFPSFFLLIFGVVMWANFSRYGAESLYLYFPVVLIALTVLVIFLPLPLLAHKSRRWFAYSHWRLLLAGIYPVEFRDFFLGDMYCSLTYCMANVELFFCLYTNNWENPAQCNSNHSRLLGFLTTLPALWRFFQCLRRYKDTRNVFPHLVNGGKYSMTILSNVLLSNFRIHRTNTNMGLFIFFSVVNSIYCSIWDLFMDFSLLQFHSRHFWLRDILALKSKWPYYFVMTVDPVLRFSWILYVVLPKDANHSTIFSFGVALLEVTRRGMWALFRVENEHCANVGQYKASRDVPLPYRIEPLITQNTPSAGSSPMIDPDGKQQQQQPGDVDTAAALKRAEATHSSSSAGTGPSAASTTTPLEPSAPSAAHTQTVGPQRHASSATTAPTGGGAGAFSTATSATAVASTSQSGGLFRRRTDSARTFSKMLADAHTQDFEKKRKKKKRDGDGHSDADGVAAVESDDGEDDDDSDDESPDERAMMLRESARLMRRGDGGAIMEEEV
ncbi:signal transduction [Cordyceps militaris]|uniref:Signal transduction n=1 Tax=Cordyceps militaris TaxID=73501 RepID=A0A2H4SDK4_CORMI|nr:signal transduction [Cordyceps militaris]